MTTIIRRTAAASFALAIVLPFALPGFAGNTALTGGASKTSKTTYLQNHPKVKSTLVGAGVGVAAGAATGLVSGKGMGRGAAIGAGTGAGVGLVQSSKTLDKHPVIKNVATGTLAGLGVGMAASRGEGAGKKVAGATAIGAGLGLAAGLLKDKLK